MDLNKEFTQNQLLLLQLSENAYAKYLEKIISCVREHDYKVCYVCLGRPYNDVKTDMDSEIRKNFFFVDVLSSHYEKPPYVEDCTFINEPRMLTQIRVAVLKAVEDKGCDIVLFDAISNLLAYRQPFAILRFTHELMYDKVIDGARTIFVVTGNPTKELDNFVKDIEMFAGKSISLNNTK